MYDGKKSVAFGIFYDAIDLVGKKVSEEEGIDVWKRALNNVMPMVEVKARRVGGATFQIPMEIAPERRAAMGIKWIIMYARKRNEKSMAEKLAAEVIAASKGEGATVKKKDDTHKMAEANKAFAHFKA
jgi:small subunit ribosomal protein S7